MKNILRSFPARWRWPGVIAGLALAAQVYAGELTRGDIEKRVSPPIHVQEKLADVPVWPLVSELEPDAGPVGYMFESIDLAPLPGFEGTPLDFLVSIDRKGNFLGVELLRQHEPVFVGGIGEEPLRDFIGQYVGHNIKQQYLISPNSARQRIGAADQNSNQVKLDGITKATASVRIVNQTILTSALEVARAKLGFSVSDKRGPVAQIRTDVSDPAAFGQMLKNGMVGKLALTNAEAEKLFAGSDGEGLDEDALRNPEEKFITFYIAYLNAPSIGRAILGDEQYKAIMARNYDHHHLWWIASSGRYPIIDGNFIPGTQSSRLAMAQDGLVFELRDQGHDVQTAPEIGELNASRIFGMNAEAGLDPGRPIDLSVIVTRAKGMILPTLIHRQATLPYSPPKDLFVYPPEPTPEWLLAWKQRLPELGLLLVALAGLAVVLARPRWVSINARRLKMFRIGFLMFTLGFLGWYAQGQLSVVQVTGALKAVKNGQGFAVFLYDPVTLMVIAFTFAAFVIWGRGTFCGWLCPFGAMQELVGNVARFFGLGRVHIPPSVARRLEHFRYVVLATLVIAALYFPSYSDRLNELEPFKTAITVGFDRQWPFVLYAVAVLLASAFYFKFFCRFVCPLGAFMSLGGRLRRFDWLTRRNECGKPCQSCKAKCAYDAIEQTGEIRYDACFQCLDCVGIYHDPNRCAPVLLHRKKGKVLTPTGVMLGSGKQAERGTESTLTREPETASRSEVVL